MTAQAPKVASPSVGGLLQDVRLEMRNPPITTDKALLEHPDYKALQEHVTGLDIAVVIMMGELEGCTDCLDPLVDQFVRLHCSMPGHSIHQAVNETYSRKLPESLMQTLRDRFGSEGLL